MQNLFAQATNSSSTLFTTQNVFRLMVISSSQLMFSFLTDPCSGTEVKGISLEGPGTRGRRDRRCSRSSTFPHLHLPLPLFSFLSSDLSYILQVLMPCPLVSNHLGLGRSMQERKSLKIIPI